MNSLRNIVQIVKLRRNIALLLSEQPYSAVGGHFSIKSLRFPLKSRYSQQSLYPEARIIEKMCVFQLDYKLLNPNRLRPFTGQIATSSSVNHSICCLYLPHLSVSSPALVYPVLFCYFPSLGNEKTLKRLEDTVKLKRNHRI